MLKKRIIFTLLFKENNFYLSRNFRLQKVGNLKWLKENYDFSLIAKSVDEIILLNVSKDNHQNKDFLKTINLLTYECFIPISVGGSIKNIEIANEYIKNGADKLVINTNLFNKILVKKIGSVFGEQCIVASIDFKQNKNKYDVYTNNGKNKLLKSLDVLLREIMLMPIGEVLLNSIDKDGTGFGFDLNVTKDFPSSFNKPIILSGGAGNYNHILEALKNKKIDSIATSNLLNFVGGGFQEARKLIKSKGIDLAEWI